jgi:peptide/nickel transport system permease protein
MKQREKLSLLYYAACAAVLLVLLTACLAPLLAPYDPTAVSADEILEHASWKHWLGTDALGRDVLSRVIYGTRTSVALASAAAFCTMLAGMTLGMLGGYFGGWTDRIIQFFVNLFQGLPGMSLMVAIAGILPDNDFRLVIAVTLTSWAGFSRIVRSEVIRIRSETYMESIRSLGAGHLYILRHYVWTNTFPLIVVLLTLKIGSSLLSASALSYLGLGVSPPTADWGVMISDARMYFRSYPLMIMAPGLCITLFCISINLIGDMLRDRLSVKSENRERNL